MSDRSQAFDHIPALSKQVDNVLYNAEDGSVWACYLLQGLNTNPYNLDKVTGCQLGNARLFGQLSHLPASDFLLLGLKAQTSPEVIMARCSAGIEDLSTENYPELREEFDTFYQRVVGGELAEYNRVYVLCIGFPTRQSFMDRMMSSVAVVDPHRNVDPAMIAELEPRYFNAIPPEFRPVRITADHMSWIFDRARLRGITVPIFPDNAGAPRMAVGARRSFPEVVINKNADTDALYEDFLEKAVNADPKVTSRGKHRVPVLPAVIGTATAIGAAVLSVLAAPSIWVALLTFLTVLAFIANAMKVAASAHDSRKMMRDSFASTRWSRALSVHDVQSRSAEFPDGYTSYQTQVAIGGYPTFESYGVNAFTYMVDQEIFVDADFALRFDFKQDLITKAGLRRRRKELDAEDNANTQDELDAEDYADVRNELRAYRAAVKSEPAARGMRVVAVFSFAHQNLEKLNTAVDAAINHFTDHDFTPVLPVGGQFDLWKAMMPGSSCPPVLEDLKHRTTTRLFGAFMPVRRTVIGDPVGMPIAINKENELGQIVHRDLLHATVRGNASIAMVGAPRAGKSQLMKKLIGFMVDLKRPVHVVDQDPHGEQEVFAQSITDAEIVHVTEPHRSTGGGSLDPLKCYPPEQAAQEFLRLWMPLLGITRKDKQASVLAMLVSPEYRQSARIFSTRDLIERLRGGIAKDGAGDLLVAFEYWAHQPYTAAFIDPMVDGRVINDGRGYPPFNPEKLLVVFRTHQLTVSRPTPGQAPQLVTQESEEELFAAMCYTAIARLTRWRFHHTPGACMFAGDEMRFLKGSKVLKDLVEEPDRMGAKDENFVVVAAQMPGDLDEHVQAIECKVALRQGTSANAAGTLEWIDMPPTEKLIKRMVEETSRLNPETMMPDPDKRGQGWLNVGGDIARVQYLDHMRARRRRFADTTSSTRLRDRDLPALASTAPNGATPPRVAS